MNNIRKIGALVVLFGMFSGAPPALADAMANDGAECASSIPAQRFRQALSWRDAGNLDAALTCLDALRDDYPFDVDYALARAQIYSRLERVDDALRELEAATELAPHYEDVWKLRLNLLARGQSGTENTDHESLRLEAAERFPDADWWRAADRREASRWTLLLGASHDALSNSLPGWNGQFVELSLDPDPDRRYLFRLARDERYAGADSTVGVGIEHAWKRGWFAGLDLTTAGGAEFQPELGYGGHAGTPLADGWVVDLRYRRRQYPSATVDSLTGTVENYFGDFRISYALGMSRLQGASNSLNHGLTANWYYNDNASVGFTLSTGEEAEAVGNGRVLETEVRGFSVSGRRKLSDRFGLQWWLGVHDQGDYYRRHYLGMAVSIRI